MLKKEKKMLVKKSLLGRFALIEKETAAAAVSIVDCLRAVKKSKKK